MKRKDVIFDSATIEIFKSMVGKTFNKYKHDEYIYSPCVFGIIGVYVDGKAYKLTNILKNVTRFLTDDEVATFELKETEDSKIATFMDNGEMIETPVNDVIKSIKIVTDHQRITTNDNVYEFNHTVGLIFTLAGGNEISFEIGTWFSEMITIQRGYDLIEKFTKTDEFLEEWEDCDGFVANITREITVIE